MRKSAEDEEASPDRDTDTPNAEQGAPTSTGLNKDRMFEHGDFVTVRPTRLSLDHQSPSTGFSASTVIEGEAPSTDPPPPPEPIPVITPLIFRAKAIKAAIGNRVEAAFPNAPKYLVGAVTLLTALFATITITGAAKLIYDRHFATPSPVPEPVRAASLPLPSNTLTYEAELAAYAVIKSYVEADGIEAKQAFIRHPEKSLPAMQEWYDDPRSSHELPPHKAGQILLRKRLAIADHDVIALAVDIFPEAVTRFFLVERIDAQTYKIDWESSSGYQQVRLEDFREKKPLDPVPFRVNARRSDYYNYGFTEEKYDAYRLSYPTNPAFFLYAYIEKLATAAADIRSYLPPGAENSASLILNLGYPENADSTEHVIIHDLLLPHWLED
ncbi:MAG: hypothetical protein P8J87_03665 [Verrucomicrobiales bacterium]|nr:hypothetical protein [Verrucomicrobiales bacterium]